MLKLRYEFYMKLKHTYTELYTSLSVKFLQINLIKKNIQNYSDYIDHQKLSHLICRI